MGYSSSSARPCQQLDFLDHCFGRIGYQCRRNLDAVDFLQVALDLARGHPTRVHRDNLVVEAGPARAELIPYTCARMLVPEGGPHVLALGERLRPASPAYPLTLNADESPFLQRILSDQKSVSISDTKQEEGWHTFKGHGHLRSWLSVPLVASDEYLGLLSVGHNDPNRFTQEHLRRAELLTIPAAWSPQGGIKHVRVIGRRDNDNVARAVQARPSPPAV